MRVRCLFIVAGAALFAMVMAPAAHAFSLFVDSAPNVYGSPLYPAWQTATYATVAAGTFVNMGNGINPANVGTTDFEIEDEVVYSFGDLGKRLHWIYWIPGETVASLQGRFQISLFNYWGEDEPLDFYLDNYGQTWLEPTSWIDYEGGVIGTAGMAWWGAYGENTQEALDADLAAWRQVTERWVFTAKLDGVDQAITCDRMGEVPEPSSLLLIGGGLIGFVAAARKRRR